MQTIPNLCISATGSRDGAAARSGLGVINGVGGVSIDLFTLLVAPAKWIKVKLNVLTHTTSRPPAEADMHGHYAINPCISDFLLPIFPL